MEGSEEVRLRRYCRNVPEDLASRERPEFTQGQLDDTEQVVREGRTLDTCEAMAFRCAIVATTCRGVVGETFIRRTPAPVRGVLVLYFYVHSGCG